MEGESEKSRDFHHPYQPYDIQVQLMNAIYDCIAGGKIGLFESPTGTGKSLSLICSSLTWLRDAQEQNLRNQAVTNSDDDEPSWVQDHARKERKQALIERNLQYETRLRQIRAKEVRQRQKYQNSEPMSKRVKITEKEKSSNVLGEAYFELDDYNSEEEEQPKASAATQLPSDQGLSSKSVHLMEQLGLMFKEPSEQESQDPVEEMKIYFCSRTHSQLTQFVHEVRRVDVPPASWAAEADPRDKVLVKHVPLGSRKNLCVNPKVSKLGSAAAINERCLDLQQPNTPKEHKCKFIPNKDNETLVNDFRDHTLADVRDIEDLGDIGKRIGICPYYASRATIKPSEIITLPYPLLLQKTAREALDISLKGHVVIIDEAHNLMDTISSIHSVNITYTQLKRCRTQIDVYLQKFRNKLKGKNRIYVAQVVRLIDSISGYLDRISSDANASEGIANFNELMSGKGVDQINLYKLMHYLQKSKLARKVEGYAIHIEEQGPNSSSANEVKVPVSKLPVLTHVESFFQTLTNPAAEGRFFYDKDDQGQLCLKYMLLDPSFHFKEIVEDARAVILAGGTLSPMNDYVRHLFAYVPPSRLQSFSCGHIIPKENLVAIPVAKGPGGIDFDFTYDKRNASATLSALGEALISLCAAIPDGVVVFFPSYAYLDLVVHQWWRNPSSQNTKTIWDRLQSIKPIFRESKASAGESGDVLTPYTDTVSSGRGALLLSIVNGKLSEGINFSDALGRGIVIVGLPFPNIQSAQWKAKLEYIENGVRDSTGSREEGIRARREFYENACMRGVNQSIGRAIRHRGDYASIVLLDRRYRTERIQGKLPGWIRQAVDGRVGDADFEDVIGRLRGFFEKKKT